MTVSFTELMASFAQDTDGTCSVTIPAEWMQGRSTYGGLSAAICLKAVYGSLGDLPPLRSAQVSFIGPAGGPITVKTQELRRGKSVTYAGADVVGEQGIATRAVFAFGAPRDSAFDEEHIGAPPSVPRPEDCGPLFPGGFGPAFTQFFEPKLGLGGAPCTGSDAHEHFVWVRHKDREDADMLALIAHSAMAPPAIFPKFTEYSPGSSMNWHINILAAEPSTEDGWWLIRSAIDTAQNGYSSQDMTIWNKAGFPVMSMKQCVAYFA